MTKEAKPLLDQLGGLFPDSSRTTLRKLLQSSRVRVNGEIEKNGSRLITLDDVVDVARRSVQNDLHPSLQLLHEDDDLVVVVKKEGLLTVASPGEQEATAQAYLNHYLKAQRTRTRVQVVHRLDRDTSGVLVFPKHFAAKEKLKEQFAAHSTERIYVAVVAGNVPQDRGTLQSFLDDEKPKVRVIASPTKGKLAVTHYRTIRRSSGYSMLEIELETGKRNQIRVQLAGIGHPVVGDGLYGTKEDPIGRLALHAKFLSFIHPTSGKKMSFTAPVPDAFMRLMRESGS